MTSNFRYENCAYDIERSTLLHGDYFYSGQVCFKRADCGIVRSLLLGLDPDER